MLRLRDLNLHAGLIAWGFLAYPAHRLGIIPGATLEALILFGGMAVYSLDRIGSASKEDVLNAPDRTRRIGQHLTVIRCLTALLALLTFACIPFLTAHSRTATGIYLLLGIGYTLPILPGRKRLKDLPGIKLPLILAAWTLLPWMHPGLRQEMPVDWLLFRALILLPNLLWSDWKDRAGDQAAGVPNPARHLTRRSLFWISRLSCLSALLLVIRVPLGLEQLIPLLFWISMETLPRKHEDAFLALLDLWYLIPAAGLLWIRLAS